MKAISRSVMAASVASVFCASGALAQTNATFLLTSSNTVSPSAPSTTVEIWAVWDDPGGWYAFGGGNYDIAAGDGVFSDPVNILNGPGSSAGVAVGNTITGGANAQLWAPLPPIIPYAASPTLLAWYTWTATDFTPRTVDLVTSNTSVFNVFHANTGQPVSLFPGSFTPGSGEIAVVPAPGAWSVLMLPLAAGVRRRA
jgi:hypothetical protein